MTVFIQEKRNVHECSETVKSSSSAESDISMLRRFLFEGNSRIGDNPTQSPYIFGDWCFAVLTKCYSETAI